MGRHPWYHAAPHAGGHLQIRGGCVLPPSGAAARGLPIHAAPTDHCFFFPPLRAPDYLCDIADNLEAEVQHICDEQVKRARGRVARRDGAAGKAGGSGGSGGPTDSALHAEIAAGADAVWTAMQQAYEMAGDQFEVYAHRNVFAWPEGLEATAAAGGGSGSSSGSGSGAGAGGAARGKAYTAAAEESLAARVKALEASVAAERKRKRTLMYIRGLLGKRVPQASAPFILALLLLLARSSPFSRSTLPPYPRQAEAASKILEEVMATLQPPQKAGGAGASAEAFEAFFEQAGRLHALCARLSAASPAASQAIAAVLPAPEEEDDEDEAQGGAAGGGGGGGKAAAAAAAAGGGDADEGGEVDVLQEFAAATKK